MSGSPFFVGRAFFLTVETDPTIDLLLPQIVRAGGTLAPTLPLIFFFRKRVVLFFHFIAEFCF